MERVRSEEFEQLDRGQHAVLDRLAMRFENALKQGENPRIEESLIAEPYDSAMRRVVLHELLALEVEYRMRCGESPQADEYKQRFPDERDLVSSVFDTLDSGPGDPSGPGSTSNSSQNVATEDARSDGRPTDPPGTQPLPSQLGRYEILRLIADGGFGRVLLAKDLDLDRLVAVKIAQRNLFASSEEADLYLREARVAAQLSHPNIVAIHDVGSNDELGCYIVMDYIDGGALDVAEVASRSNTAEAVSLIAQVADAVHHAHTRGLIHRDLKPGNLLLDSRGTPYVADFGLAVHESEQYDHEGEISGTPPYMSPEQVRGLSHQLDGRTDIWSLGVLLYELLTGRKPFQGATRQRVFDEVLHRDPKPLRQIDDRIPAELERICLRALAKKPAERYGTALDLAEDLRRVMAELGEASFPVPPPVPPPIAQPAATPRVHAIWKWGAIGVGSALAVWAVTASIIALWPDPGRIEPVAIGENQASGTDAAAGQSKPRPGASEQGSWTFADLGFSCQLSDRCTSMALGGKDTLLAVATGGDVGLYRVADQGRLLASLEHENDTWQRLPIRDICLSADCSMLGVLYEGEPVICLYSTTTFEPVPTSAVPVNPVRLLTSSSPDGLSFLDRAGGALLVRDAQRGVPERRITSGPLRGIRFTMVDSAFVLTGFDAEANRWTLMANGENGPSWGDQPIHSVAVSRDGSQFLLGGYTPAMGVQLHAGANVTQLESPADDSLWYHNAEFFDRDALVVDVSQQLRNSRDGPATVIRAWRKVDTWQLIVTETIPGQYDRVALEPEQGLVCLASDSAVHLFKLLQK